MPDWLTWTCLLIITAPQKNHTNIRKPCFTKGIYTSHLKSIQSVSCSWFVAQQASSLSRWQPCCFWHVTTYVGWILRNRLYCSMCCMTIYFTTSGNFITFHDTQAFYCLTTPMLLAQHVIKICASFTVLSFIWFWVTEQNNEHIVERLQFHFELQTVTFNDLFSEKITEITINDCRGETESLV